MTCDDFLYFLNIKLGNIHFLLQVFPCLYNLIVRVVNIVFYNTLKGLPVNLRWHEFIMVVALLKLVYQKNRLKNALIKAKRDAGVKGESRSIIATYNEAIKCVNKIIRWEVKSCHIELQALHAILSYKV